MRESFVENHFSDKLNAFFPCLISCYKSFITAAIQSQHPCSQNIIQGTGKKKDPEFIRICGITDGITTSKQCSMCGCIFFTIFGSSQ